MAPLGGLLLLIISYSALSKSILSVDPIFGQPEQMHLSYGRRLKKVLG